MPSKKNIDRMRMELHKALMEKPELVKEKQTAVVAERIECATIMAADYILRYMDATPEQIEGLLKHIRLQFECIGLNKWDSYFDDMDKQLLEETGVKILGFITEEG